ncbi:MAG: pyrroline-5-carboxylate reductase [Angelakisella sp.]
MKNEKIVFIGGGNMAEGIIRGVVKDSSFDPKSIYVYDIIPERMLFLHNTYGVSTCDTLKDAALLADILVFAVRPQDAEAVSLQVAPFLKDNNIFVSICAGVSMDTFAGYLGNGAKIVRVMPNTLTEAHHGYSAVCLNKNTSNEEVKTVVSMLEAIGQVMEIQESYFDTFTAYSCAGPAYLLYIMSAMVDAGVRAGFSRKDARAMTIENMLGTAIKLEQTGLHPNVILDTMTSPAGVGIEGIYALNEKGVAGAIMHGVEEAIKRSNKLG